MIFRLILLSSGITGATMPCCFKQILNKAWKNTDLEVVWRWEGTSLMPLLGTLELAGENRPFS
jgi:hypothetical protein